ncbi:jg5370 [Pararge aegeria aegeria]|uniref:Jg5370 protein n=1 Tax=Pararge aegeria aegeria TaxID=348720 RepID=A0A8S4RQY3_9NEOP|nr:jg5370 [Pararge aegeria aegeria]
MSTPHMLVGPKRGGQMTSDESLGAVENKRPRTVDAKVTKIESGDSPVDFDFTVGWQSSNPKPLTFLIYGVFNN